MRRKIELAPLIIFIMFFLFSLCQKFFLHGPWINSFVIGLCGMSSYPPILLLVDGMAIEFRNQENMKIQNRLFYWPIIFLWFLSICFSIFLMGKN